MKTLLLPLVAAVFGSSVTHAAIQFTAVRDYDATTGANAVDTSATALTVSTFIGAVATAYDNGTGGVLNFDNRTGDNGGVGTAWQVAYNGGINALAFSLQNIDQSFVAASVGASPISSGGSDSGYFRMQGNGTNRTSNTMYFASGSYLSSFGITFLARNANIGDIRISGRYDDNSTFTLFSAASPFSNAQNSDSGATSTPDTFVGFEAPADRAIKELTFNIPASTYPVLDDFGFIVSPIPEPSGALLAGISAVGLLVSRRRI